MTTRSRPSQINQEELARRLGLSQPTVSRALSGAPGVRPTVRERILEAAHELGYRPDPLAQGLRGGRSHAIGLITDDITAPVASRIARGVEAAAHDDGLAILFCNTSDDLDKERRQLEALRQRRVDGVIFAGTWRRRRVRPPPQADLRDLPHVFVNSITRGLSCILSDDAQGQRLAVEHLLALGHIRIALVNGPDGLSPVEHLRGCREALVAAGLPIDESLIVAGDWREESGYAATTALLALPEPPTAIACANDLMALGVLDALRDTRQRVPEDVSVVGFDDREFAPYLRPPLTTVALPLEAMGREALRLLVGQISGTLPFLNNRDGESSDGLDRLADALRVPCALVQRASTGPRAGGAGRSTVGPTVVGAGG